MAVFLGLDVHPQTLTDPSPPPRFLSAPDIGAGTPGVGAICVVCAVAEHAAAALAHAVARAVPGLGAGPPAPAAAQSASKPAGRSTRAKSAVRTPRVHAASARPPASAKPEGKPAGRSTRAKPSARAPLAGPRGAASGRPPAPRGQTQAKVLAALRAAPGSTSAAVATAAEIPSNTAAATLSRLVKQGRVRRLEEGGYALVETPAGAAQTGTASATTDAAAAASDTPDAPGARGH